MTRRRTPSPDDGPDARTGTTRIERAREITRTAKAIAAVAAVGAFAVAAVLARVGHPGGAGAEPDARASGALSPPSSFEDRLSEPDFFGGGDIGSSDQADAAPQARTHTS